MHALWSGFQTMLNTNEAIYVVHNRLIHLHDKFYVNPSKGFENRVSRNKKQICKQQLAYSVQEKIMKIGFYVV